MQSVNVQLTEPQHKFIFSRAKFPALIGGLGSGKSQGGTFRVAKLMLEDPGISCAYYFPTYDLINLRGIPGLVKDLDLLGLTKHTVNKSNFTVTVHGYGDVIFRSYDCPERIVAYEVAHSIVDEIDTLPKEKATTVWRKVVERNRQPCNHEHGNTVGCVTTPDQGQLGFAFEKWGGVELQEGYELIRASTYSNPFLPDDYIDNILKNYNSDLAKLYLDGEFVSLSQRMVFDSNKLSESLKLCIDPKQRMILELGAFIGRDDGELKVWDNPKRLARYTIGADVAEGLEKGDYSSADVLEVLTGRQVAQYHGHISPDSFGDYLNALGKWYNMAFIGVEANNHGLTTNVRLRELEYPNLYLQKKIDDGRSGTVEQARIGWLTTSKSKPYIIDQLSAEVRENTHGIVCKETIQEMQSYITLPNGSTNAQIGCYDDRVMSRAIAGEMLRQCPAYDMVINHSWWQLWSKDKPIPACKHQFVSLKISFESIDDNKIAYSAYTRWGIFENEMTGDDCIIALGLWTKRAQYDEIRDMIKGINTKHDPDLFLINRKQSGDSLFKDLKKAMPGKIRNTGTAKADDELTQAHSISTVFKAGQVFIPDGKEWALSMIDYVSQYPNCNDIGVSIMNTVTQALIYLRSGSWFSDHPKDKDDLPATFERVLSDSEQEDLDDTQDTRIIYYG